jgi:hypothetical protein
VTVPLVDVVGAPDTELVTTAVVVASAVVDAAADDAEAELAAELDAAALEDAVASGTETVTPASAHVCSTASMVACWSEAEHASCTQGVTEAIRESNFWQWHAKSVREEQPSLESGETKQFNCGIVS